MKGSSKEQWYYFSIFLLLSLFYIFYGYAALGTNDDWALENLLRAKGVYGTLIMSYPLSYLMSHLYDLFPNIPWYSLLLSSVMLLNFYLIAIYIKERESWLQKITLLILTLLLMSYLWFNLTITAVTILTMLSTLGLSNRNLYQAILLLFLASILRTGIMFILLPFFVTGFLIVRDRLSFHRGELVAAGILLLLIVGNLALQKQDKAYMEWLTFNKARASIADLHGDRQHHALSHQEYVILTGGWVQDREILPTSKVLEIAPSLQETIRTRLKTASIEHYFTQYKFHYWIWLLTLMSLVAVMLNITNRKALLIPVFVAGVFLLLLIRDVERVTVLLIVMWAFILSKSLKPYRHIDTLFLLLFTALFYYYSSGQLGYRHYKENMALQKEAKTLIKTSGIACEPSINFPTRWTPQVTSLFQANYLFREKRWPKLDQKEILPAGWLSRHPYFYTTHRISHGRTQRDYQNYHDFLLDEHTGFIGGKTITDNQKSKILLERYDALYLKDRPDCRHRVKIIKSSEHFAISQIVVECNGSVQKRDIQ